MDNSLNKTLTIPPIIQQHSGLLKMLTHQKQGDYNTYPLKWPDQSLITQDQLNIFAERYQPNFNYKQLSLDDMIETAYFHDYFQIDSPNQQLENELYQNILLNKLTKKQIKDLPSNLLHLPTSRFIKTTHLDAKLLEPYSNHILKNKAITIKDKRKHSDEKLFFSNNTTKIYGAYDIPWFTIVGGFPNFTSLLVKNNQNNIQQEIKIRPTDDGYWVDDMIIHQSGLYAIAEYYSNSKDDNQSSFGILNLTSGKTTSLWDILQISQQTNHVCCFSKDVIYTCINNDKKLILNSISLDNHERKEVAILDNPDREQINTIVSNKDGNCIVIATDRTLFVVKNNGKTIKTIDMVHNSSMHTIKKLSLNNSGTLLCIITGYYKKYEHDKPVYAYLCNLTELDKKTNNSFYSSCINSWTEITDKIHSTIDVQNLPNQSPDPYRKLCLTDIKNLKWNRDDSLLVLECDYHYQNFYQYGLYKGLLADSGPIGQQYVFICPSTCNSWSENKIHEDKSRINSANTDNETIIINDSSSWSLQTKLLKWYDENMTNALSYLNGKNLPQNYSYNEKLLGLILLKEIIEQQNTILQLDLEKTKTYNKYIPDPIKSILTTTRTILLSEKNESPIKKTLYRWYIYSKTYSKNFLYYHRKAWIYSFIVGIIPLLLHILHAYHII
jgi:hypothetical protein